ncbi:hypothetical protein KSF78_0009021 [Schistosoma japonicum]|nr:hypothetical protein KSF78_0009021 [Schistosoma japonicum]
MNMFHCTSSSVPTGSDGWKCDEAVFLPKYVQIYGMIVLCTSAQSSISYSYLYVSSLNLRALLEDVVSTILKGTSGLSLGIAQFALDGEFYHLNCIVIYNCLIVYIN